MAMNKMVDGKMVAMNAAEIAQRQDDEAKAALPPTQAEKDAAVDGILNRADPLVNALKDEIYALAKAADPALTPVEFDARLRGRMLGPM